MSQNKGLGKVDHYARLACLSKSRFRKRFVEEVGLSPKQFQQLLRIGAITKYYQNHPGTSLTHLAYQFGYFDQPHFIKDFKGITNSAPLSYFKNRRFLQF